MDPVERARLETKREIKSEEAKLWGVAEHLLKLISRRYKGGAITILPEDLEAAGALYHPDPEDEEEDESEIDILLPLHQAMGRISVEKLTARAASIAADEILRSR
jgi:hypothetical protein